MKCPNAFWSIALFRFFATQACAQEKRTLRLLQTIPLPEVRGGSTIWAWTSSICGKGNVRGGNYV
jgi:hypothetical protein